MGNANLHFPATFGQLKGMMIVRGITSLLSLIGSSFIMQDVLRSPSKRHTIRSRILCAMSSMDFLFAIKCMTNAWPAPKGTPWAPSAIGTWRSCEVFGFLGQASRTSSVLYNGSLALYYLLTIRYNWRESKMKHLEPWLHAIPLLFGWVTALVALPLDLYNPISVGCTIRSYPLKCGEESAIPCQRGENAYLYQVAFFYAPLWTCFFFLVVAMTLIYRKMSQLQATNELHQPERQYSSSEIGIGSSSVDGFGRNSITRTPSTRENTTKRQFAIQALLYCTAYAITWFFGLVNQVVQQISPSTGVIPLVFLHMIFGSLQGGFNALIYIRPRYIRHREQQQRSMPQLPPLEESTERVTGSSILMPWTKAPSQIRSSEGPEREPSDEEDGLSGKTSTPPSSSCS